jgi:hypothetical protein
MDAPGEVLRRNGRLRPTVAGALLCCSRENGYRWRIAFTYVTFFSIMLTRFPGGEIH